MLRAWINSHRNGRIAAAIAIMFEVGTTLAVDHDVMVIDHEFIPSEIPVAPGDTINWIWVNGGHTITSGTGCIPDFDFFNAPLSRDFPIFSYTIANDLQGKIPYFCLPHCDIGMVGLIVVSPAGIPGDISPPGGDGSVDAADLGALLAQWGQCPAGEKCPADIAPPEGDGVVGPADLGLLLANWS